MLVREWGDRTPTALAGRGHDAAPLFLAALAFGVWSFHRA